jgi:hypothetical protein
MLRRVAIVRTELNASNIKVTRIGELGTLAVTSNRRSRVSLVRTEVSEEITRATRA